MRVLIALHSELTSLKNFCQLDRCEVLSPYMCYLNFLDYKISWTSFCIYNGHLDFLFCEAPAQVFCSFWGRLSFIHMFIVYIFDFDILFWENFFYYKVMDILKLFSKDFPFKFRAIIQLELIFEIDVKI